MINTIEKIKKHKNELKKYKTPLYVYDFDIINKRCTEMIDFKEKLEKKINIKVNIHYSPKANNNPAILKIVKENKLNVDCMSPLELHLNKKVGFKKNQILYVCNNIDKEEMKLVHDSNILICLDSISQVISWGQIYPNTDIMVRINPEINGIGHDKKVITSGKITKFGISENNLEELLKITQKYNLNIIGIHQHLGSLFLNDKIDNYIEGVKKTLEITQKHFKNIEIIDLGGGFGVPYKKEEKRLDLNKLEKELEKILTPFIKEYKKIKEIKFEPGRYITCEAGILLGKVNAIKNENNINWIGTDIGMNELIRPSMYGSYHEITLLEEKKEKIKANICGNICEGADILAKDIIIDRPNIEDTIVVHNTGAYGYSMSSNYTGRPRPAEIMVYNNKIELIRKRDTIEYMEKNTKC